MNPQIKFREINKQVWESVWDNMPDDYRKIVANDREHRTSIFARFQNLIESDSNKEFEVWAAMQENNSPDTSNSWLNPLT